MLLLAVLSLVLAWWARWRWSLVLVGAGVTLLLWRQRFEMAPELWLQAGLWLTTPAIAWSALRWQRRQQADAAAAQAQWGDTLRATDARLADLQAREHQLSRDITQLIELYRVAKETGGAVKIGGFVDALAKLLPTMLTYRAWHLALFAADAAGRPVAVSGVWAGDGVASGAALEPQPAWCGRLLEAARQLAVERPEAGQHARSLSGAPAHVWVPLVTRERLRGALMLEAVPSETMPHVEIVARQIALQLDRVLLYEELERLAISDSLTDLPVRRFFLQRLDDELSRAQLHTTPAALLMLDIDYFKDLNDTHGHLVGDEVLRSIGGLIKANVREIDITARYGGEEFAVLLVDTAPEAARSVAERIRRAVEEQRVRAFDELVHVTISIGIADYPQHGATPALLLERADQALYRAKALGRNRVVSVDEERAA